MLNTTWGCKSDRQCTYLQFQLEHNVIKLLILWQYYILEQTHQHRLFDYYRNMSYSVTVSLGRGDGIRVRPRSEQSTTTPDEEQEHSDGQSLALALTNTFKLISSQNNNNHINNVKALIFTPLERLCFLVIILHNLLLFRIDFCHFSLSYILL